MFKKDKDKSKDKKKEEKEKKPKESSKDKKDKDKASSKSAKDKDKKDKKSTSTTPSKSSSSKNESKVVKALSAEYEEWIEGDHETANIEWKRVEDEVIWFRFGDAEKFSVTFPSDYPNTTDRFFVYSEASSLSSTWMEQMQEFCEKSSSKKPPVALKEVLTKAAEIYLDLDDVGSAGDDDSDDGNHSFEDTADDAFRDEAPKKREPRQGDVEFDKNKYLDVGSPAASLRLLKDLKEISSSKDDLGFSAEPNTDATTGKQNLYHWNVRLFGFDKKSDLHKDLQEYSKRSSKDFIEIEMRFSKDYPFMPPFVRVVRPRFKFLTGHVTIGGSICMELLTNSGWRSTNSIESILIQIRAEMYEGGARVDHSQSSYEYGESEAWDAFYRAARNHGWDVNNLSSNNLVRIT